MCHVDREAVAIEVLSDIALDDSRMLAERQRSIDALTLFHESSVTALEHILRKTDLEVLKDRARLYIQRIRSGAFLSMSGV
ncbi:hypothetical protein EG829_08945 [bacterium]|nr:hypothetical protein [bacterium]